MRRALVEDSVVDCGQRACVVVKGLRAAAAARSRRCSSRTSASAQAAEMQSDTAETLVAALESSLAGSSYHTHRRGAVAH